MSKKLSPTMEDAYGYFQQHGNFGSFRQSTVEALERRGLVARTDEGAYTTTGTVPVARQGTAESWAAPRPQLRLRWHNDLFSIRPTHDPNPGDYEFWDRARQGKIAGLEIAGVFLSPLASKIAAWTMGDRPQFRLKNDDAQEELNRWWADVHAQVLHAFEEAANLGDCFFAINADLTVTVLPPHVVYPLVDAEDYSRMVGWRVKEIHPHPENIMQRMTIIDDYTEEGRTRKVYRDGQLISTESWPNLTDGLIPVIPIHYGAGVDERYGHAAGDKIINVLHMYGAIFQYGADGNKRQGRPTPVFNGMGSMDDIRDFMEMFGRQIKHEHDDGTTTYKYQLDFDADNVVTLPNGSTFKWESPGSFIGDTEKLLVILFYLILQATEIPEFIWGNAISSSKASAESQLEPFVKFINKLRGLCNQWLLRMSRVMLAYSSNWMPSITDDDMADIRIRWPELTSGDGKLTLEAIQSSVTYGLLTDETALSLMPLDIEDPKAELERLKVEIERKRQEEENRNNDAFVIPPTDDAQTDEEAAELSGDEIDTMLREVMEEAGQVIAEAKHTGVMVAFPVDADTANILRNAALEAGINAEDILPADEMHLTLAYLGDSREIDVTKRAVGRILQYVVNRQRPIDAQVSGAGRFKNNAEDEIDPVYASVDAPNLPEFRERMVRQLSYSGVTVSNNHGFTPHITIAYINTDEPTPDIILPVREMKFDRLLLAWGDDWQEFEFTWPRVPLAEAGD